MAPNPKMTILVVDDFASMRHIITNILNELGYTNLIEAENGRRALEILDSQRIDFVITDWNMPEVSGLELLLKIRSSKTHPKLPVLMVTAEAMQESIIAAAQAGVNNYIIKPFDANTLAAKIAKIFK
jgi:two-component system, chemotaxis family, chemotaxis protein CheY